MKKKLLALTMGLLMLVGVGGCGASKAETTTAASKAATTAAASKSDTTAAATKAEAQLSGTVSVVGSTTVQPLAESIAKLLNKTQPKLEIEIQGVGSGAGIKATMDGTANVGMSSRELKAEEKAGIKETIIAYDGIAVIVNPKNTASALTMEQVKKIFEGDITNWKEVGGADAPIIVVSREAGSGTRSAFEEIVKLTKKDGDKDVSSVKADALIAEGNGAIKASLASKENAIAYLSEGYVDSSVKALKVNDVECTVPNIKSGTYKISRPLLLITKGDATPQAKAFIDSFLSDAGQKLVEEGNYIKVK
jgi:phosphate transport system substrate-binding protein